MCSALNYFKIIAANLLQIPWQVCRCTWNTRKYLNHQHSFLMLKAHLFSSKFFILHIFNANIIINSTEEPRTGYNTPDVASLGLSRGHLPWHAGHGLPHHLKTLLAARVHCELIFNLSTCYSVKDFPSVLLQQGSLSMLYQMKLVFKETVASIQLLECRNLKPFEKLCLRWLANSASSGRYRPHTGHLSYMPAPKEGMR